MARNSGFAVPATVLVAVLCVGFCFSAAAAPSTSLVRSTSSDEDRVSDFVISSDKELISWTAFGRQWTVRLELSDVMEDNTDYYHGTLEGDASAVVSFALLPGLDLSGMIATSERTYWIQALPVIENNLSEEERDLGIFMIQERGSIQLTLNSESLFQDPIVVDVDVNSEEPSKTCTGSASSAELSDSDKKRTISSYKVGVLFDQDWASSSKNPWASQANTLGLFNDVNAIYKAAGLGQFTPKYLKQLVNRMTTLNDMLNYFSGPASATISAMTDKTYTNYIWLVGSNIGGLAFVGTSCKGSAMDQSKKTAVAGLVSYSRLFTVKTIAHELAHNRGATHQFDGACKSGVTTNCQCSVMSYCFPSASNNPKGAVNWFSDISKGEMRTAGCN